MEKVMNIIKPKPNPQQQLRDWQRKLRQECHNIEHQIRDIQREEKSVQKAIKDAVKRNDMGSAKSLAVEIVRSRKTVNRLHENKAQLKFDINAPWGEYRHIEEETPQFLVPSSCAALMERLPKNYAQLVVIFVVFAARTPL